MKAQEIVALLRSFGIKNIRVGQNNIMMHCPNPAHDDARPSFGISIHKPRHPCCCFVCREGMLLADLVVRLFMWRFNRKITIKEAREYMRRFGSDTVDIPRPPKFYLPGGPVDDHPPAKKYLQQRLGYIPYRNVLATDDAVIFPLKDIDGILRGYQLRKIDRKEFYTRGKPYPYLLDQVMSYPVIVLVEGPIDALRLLRFRSTDMWMPVALLSTDNAYLDELPIDKRIVVCLDSDADPRKLVDKLLCMGYIVKAYRYLKPDDPGEFDEADVRRLEGFVMELFGKKVDALTKKTDVQKNDEPVTQVEQERDDRTEALLGLFKRGEEIDTLVTSRRDRVYLSLRDLPGNTAYVYIPAGMTIDDLWAVVVHRYRSGENARTVLCVPECKICTKLTTITGLTSDTHHFSRFRAVPMFLLPMCIIDESGKRHIGVLTTVSTRFYNNYKSAVLECAGRGGTRQLVWTERERALINTDKTIVIHDDVLSVMRQKVTDASTRLARYTLENTDECIGIIDSIASQIIGNRAGHDVPTSAGSETPITTDQIHISSGLGNPDKPF